MRDIKKNDTNDKFPCYAYFNLIDARCLDCRDMKQCQLETFIRKEKKYDIEGTIENGRPCENRV